MTTPTLRLRLYPFRACARLAPATARENEPDIPVAIRRELFITRPKAPAVVMFNLLRRRQTCPVLFELRQR